MSNSFHQDPRSLILRGGLEVLEAFDVLRDRYPELTLTLRTRLPDFPSSRYMEIINKGGIRIIDSFLPSQEWRDLLAQTDIFVLPSARIHVVSMLEAMAYGMAVIVSDGWGIEEYARHGDNALVVRGRYGKVTWMESGTGILREDYSQIQQSSPAIVQQIVDHVTRLIDDPDMRYRLQMNARKSAETEFSIGQWNDKLKSVFDHALGRSAARS